MVGIHEDTLYHIYARDRCIYNCLDEEEFEETWEMLKVMVGILQTDYTQSDLSYVKVKVKVGYGGPGKVIYTEPMGDDSYWSGINKVQSHWGLHDLYVSQTWPNSKETQSI